MDEKDPTAPPSLSEAQAAFERSRAMLNSPAVHEITMMRLVVEALEGMPQAARERVVRWLATVYAP